jgi:hypothetical protein
MSPEIAAMADAALEKLQKHVRYQLGHKAKLAAPWRVDELTRLTVRHWPHHHLEAAMSAGGKNHKALEHAVTLCRAQVREQWEARQGVSPMYDLVLTHTTAAIAHVILELWASDDRWRAGLRAMSRRQARP